MEDREWGTEPRWATNKASGLPAVLLLQILKEYKNLKENPNYIYTSACKIIYAHMCIHKDKIL